MDAVEAEVVRAFTSGEATGERLRMIETHGARVFLGRARAYKAKRHVRYPYMDFSTPALREAALRRELALNRRTAPGHYLSLAALVRGADGKLALDGAGQAIEPILVMRRFADGALYSERLAAGTLVRADIEHLAATIADFHATAEVTRTGASTRMRGVVEENAAELPVGGVLPRERVNAFNDGARAELERRSPLLERRAEQGFVRRCHGDLHLANVFDDAGTPRLFDCIEFNEALATIDILYDFAFLAMDLAARGRADLANAALNRYLISWPPQEWQRLFDGLALMPLFLSQRAAIRAHVSIRASRIDDAKRYFALACVLQAAPQPRLVVTAGLSGTGKSELARRLAPSLARQSGAVILRSDEIRKRLCGAAIEARLPPTAYSAETNARVYETMFALAERALRAAHPVVLDAVFARESERRRAEAVAARAGAAFAGLWLEAPPDVLRRRVGGRTDDASDADVRIVERQLGYDLGPIPWPRIDASGSPDHTESLARALLPQV